MAYQSEPTYGTSPPPPRRRGVIWGAILLAAVVVLALVGLYSCSNPDTTTSTSTSTYPTPVTDGPATAEPPEYPPVQDPAQYSRPADEPSVSTDKPPTYVNAGTGGQAAEGGWSPGTTLIVIGLVVAAGSLIGLARRPHRTE